jgi:hypothetical protein
MLPRGAAPDWLQAGSWPAQGPQPRAALLERSRALALPPAPAQVYCIVGTGQPTVTAARVHDAQLRYHITLDGDGTVPRASAALDGHTCRYATLAHSELPRDTAVATAGAALLQTGDTQRQYAASRLPSRPPRSTSPRCAPRSPPSSTGSASGPARATHGSTR